MKRSLLTIFAYALLAATSSAHAQLAKQIIPASVVDRLQRGIPVELIVEYDATTIEREANTLRLLSGGLDRDNTSITGFRSNRYTAIKNAVENNLMRTDIDSIEDYDHLPMAFKRFGSLAALQSFLAHPNVVAVYENAPLHHALTTSLPFIGEPTVAAAGLAGAGTTVAVIDDGINYTAAAFGFCTAPGVPAGCKVVASVEFGTGTTDNSHGTNVSAIVLGVAPASQIAMLNAFSGTTASSSNVISAINWSISNRAALNIVAINMSLGDSSKNTSACSNANVFFTPITNARNAGISAVAASGNDTYTNAIAKPACTPGVISVGAVYDANWGGVSWGSGLCTDSSTAADQVTCFSNSANYLSMLAPGALITAAGIQEGGTSQASPHVAGAIAVLRANFPNETLAQIATRLTSSGTPVTDSRNGLVKPRLNLLAAAQPSNDMFASRSTVNGSSGSVSGTTRLASKEFAEPNHAGNNGGHSVWWKWTAPANGQVSIDTHGSDFDTLLAIYKGTAVSTLQQIAANDNDGSANGASAVLFQAQTGIEYELAVDGANGTSGSTWLNWSLNTSAQANLSAAISGPTSAASGSDTTFTATITNAGPQSATNATLTIALPTNVSFVSGSSNCTATNSVITCTMGAIASGTTGTVNITVTWNGSGTLTLPISASSDVPDPIASDNTSSFQTQFYAVADNDIPAMPTWALVSLAMLLMQTVIKSKPATRQQTMV